MVFFSRDKEPKLTNILVLTIAAAALLVIISRMPDPHRLIFANGALTVYFMLTSVFLFIAFWRQAAFNPYSYNIILYAAFGFYVLLPAWTHAYLTLRGMIHPESFTCELLLRIILNSPRIFLLITAPLLIILSAYSIFSTVFLIVESKDVIFQNSFGILLPVLILAGLAVIADYSLPVYYAKRELFLDNLLLSLSAVLYLYFECLLLGTVSAILLTANYHIRTGVDNLIILGCGLEPDGTPTQILRKRLNTALLFAEDQNKRFGKNLNFVPSGGQGEDEIRSEASSMKEYLLSHGIPEKQIFLEETSVRTKENMLNSAEVIRSLRPDGKTAFVTTNFHIFRSGIYAIHAGLKAVGISAPTSWYYWPNAVAREFIGITAENKKMQVIILVCFIFIYIILTILAY